MSIRLSGHCPEEEPELPRRAAVPRRHCERVASLWDAAVASFLNGDPAVPPSLVPWARSYSGAGPGEVVLDAFAEPYLGDLFGQPRIAFLALNPGRAVLDFQGRSGIFANEIRNLGSYRGWAATWPYLRDPWVSSIGPNRHHRSRLGFMRAWLDDDNAHANDMVAFELYPWHSTSVTAAMRPPPHVIRELVLEPLRELGVPVFAFGAPWLNTLSAVGLPAVDRLGAAGRPCGSTVPSRSIVVYDLGSGVVVVVEKHAGSAGPPRREEAQLLRSALDPYL